MSEFTDSDFAGLNVLTDRELVKIAAGLPELSTGNAWADMGLYFVPGVGTAMTAYDAARNYGNAFSDFRHGRVLKGLGNLGSGILNTGLAGLDVLTLGLGGRIVGGGLKLLGRGAKAVGKASRLGRAGEKMVSAGRGLRKADIGFQNAARHWAKSQGGWIGRTMVKHPGKTGLGMGLGLAGTSIVGEGMLSPQDQQQDYGQQPQYDSKMLPYDQSVSDMHYTPSHARNYNSWSSMPAQPRYGGVYGNPYDQSGQSWYGKSYRPYMPG